MDASQDYKFIKKFDFCQTLYKFNQTSKAFSNFAFFMAVKLLTVSLIFVSFFTYQFRVLEDGSCLCELQCQ